ncbi:MAG: ATP-binding protein [Patescibacteria group bacterium]|nr:ATP-binding protein [Patescibacteria group bacterium]
MDPSQAPSKTAEVTTVYDSGSGKKNLKLSFLGLIFITIVTLDLMAILDKTLFGVPVLVVNIVLITVGGFLIRSILKRFNSQQIIQQKKFTEIALSVQSSLREREDLEEVLQSIHEGVIITNTVGIIRIASRKALEILKTSLGTVQGKQINEVLNTDSDKIIGSDFKIQLTSFEGEKILINVSVSPLRGKHEEIKGKIYSIRDVTSENEFEQMKLDFVAITAHQLRTPLTSIKGYLFFLKEAVVANPDKLNDDEKLFLDRSIISADRLASLIENLLNTSQIEKGTLKVELKPVNIEEIIKDAVDMLSINAKQKNIQLIIDKMEPPSIPVIGDVHLLNEVLSNLIMNGIAYNHPGGWVMVSLQKQPEGAIVHVSDSGRGIPSSALPHLFTKFFRVSNSLTQMSKGIGLGLYIVKSIIDAHKGRIWVNSIEDKGTTFSFFIPSAPVSNLS